MIKSLDFSIIVYSNLQLELGVELGRQAFDG